MPKTLERPKFAPGSHKAPRDAFLFNVPLEFEFAESEGAVTIAPVKMLARTADAIDHWYWGKCIHDMEGVQLKERIPLDWNHWSDVNVGFANQFKADKKTGLEIGGFIVSTKPDDMAAEILARGKAGVPYEASIDFRGPKRIEIVPEGATAKVNGQTFEGPGVIFRTWPLKSAAVCTYGADGGTSTQFSKSGGARNDEEPAEIEVTLFTEQAPMTVQATSSQATDAPADVQQLSTSPQTPPAAVSDPTPVDPAKQFAAKLAQFNAEFGAVNGSKWAAEGKSYEEALKLHASELSAGSAAKDKQIEELQAKLKAVDVGEPAPVSFSEKDGKATEVKGSQLASKLGNSVAKFAAEIQLPAKK